jgi:hypothetical protein
MLTARTTFSWRGIQDRGWEGRACLVRFQAFEVGQDGACPSMPNRDDEQPLRNVEGRPSRRPIFCQPDETRNAGEGAAGLSSPSLQTIAFRVARSLSWAGFTFSRPELAVQSRRLRVAIVRHALTSLAFLIGEMQATASTPSKRTILKGNLMIEASSRLVEADSFL